MTTEDRGNRVMYWGGVVLGTGVSGTNLVVWWAIIALSVPMLAWHMAKYPD